MKLMAIDYGEKRVGLASTDDSGTFALPRAVFPNDSELVAKVIKFKEEEGVGRIILGESKDFSGAPNAVMRDVERFKVELEKRGAEVVLHPELLTTVEARRLQGNTPMTDASAAALILKSYIDTQR